MNAHSEGSAYDPADETFTVALRRAKAEFLEMPGLRLTLAQAQDIAAKEIGYTMDFVNSISGKTIADASDALSRGWELELQFNPNRYWTVKATGNKQEAIDSNI